MIQSPLYEASFLLSYELDFLPEDAFTRDVAREIGVRDNWTCTKTGKRFQDGNLVDIAHYDHDRNRPWYNSVRNGRVLARVPHLEEHIQWWLTDDSPRIKQMVRLNAQRCWGYIDDCGRKKEGLHTYVIYNRSPEAFYFDRQVVISTFEKYCLNPNDFFILDNGYHLPK